MAVCVEIIVLFYFNRRAIYTLKRFGGNLITY